jgi:hypothetical protein
VLMTLIETITNSQNDVLDVVFLQTVGIVQHSFQIFSWDKLGNYHDFLFGLEECRVLTDVRDSYDLP